MKNLLKTAKIIILLTALTIAATAFAQESLLDMPATIDIEHFNIPYHSSDGKLQARIVGVNKEIKENPAPYTNHTKYDGEAIILINSGYLTIMEARYDLGDKEYARGWALSLNLKQRTAGLANKCHNFKVTVYDADGKKIVEWFARTAFTEFAEMTDYKYPDIYYGNIYLNNSPLLANSSKWETNKKQFEALGPYMSDDIPLTITVNEKGGCSFTYGKYKKSVNTLMDKTADYFIPAYVVFTQMCDDDYLRTSTVTNLAINGLK